MMNKIIIKLTKKSKVVKKPKDQGSNDIIIGEKEGVKEDIE